MAWESTAGGFGSFFDSSRRPVAELIMERMPATILLSVSSIVLAWLIGIPVGILSAWYQYSALDYAVTFFAFVGISIPSFFRTALVICLCFEAERPPLQAASF